MSKSIYFDNNATTMMPPQSIKSMVEWCNKGNPSSSYKSANSARAMIKEFKMHIAKLCGVSCCNEASTITQSKKIDPNLYKIIITSCASESNTTVLRGAIDSYSSTVGKPHVVISSIEHKCILEAAKSYADMGFIDLTMVPPTLSGHIDPEDVRRAIRPNTCLICVMHANNETGAINDIKAIGSIAHDANVPFHTDAVQTFGKHALMPTKTNVDSFSISFHKLYGPPGVGALVIKKQFLHGFKLKPLIYGSQNEGLRGGTENIMGIAAAFESLKYNFTNRLTKNKNLLHIKNLIITELSNRMPTSSYSNYYENSKRNGKKPEIEVVFISGKEATYLNNTILLSVVKRSNPPICNAKLKSELERDGIIVSIGSACNTASPKASHVLTALDADQLIRKGTLRISLGDTNTEDEAKKFIKSFLLILKNGSACDQ